MKPLIPGLINPLKGFVDSEAWILLKEHDEFTMVKIQNHSGLIVLNLLETVWRKDCKTSRSYHR